MNKKLRTALLTAITVLLFALTLAFSASAATSISKAVISYTASYSYTGSYIKPRVTVKLDGKNLSADNYTVSYKNNKNVGKATLTVKGKGKYTGSVTKSFYIEPAKLKNVKASAYPEKITLSWSKSTGATAYQVFMFNSSTGKWVKKATVTKCQATITNLDPGTIYKFKIRAYAKSTKYLYSPYSSLSVKTSVDRVTGLKSTPSTDSVALTWSKVKNANGYQVYLYDDAGRKWVRKKTLTSNSFTLTGLESASSLKIKVRAYNNKNSKLVYGSFSSAFVASTKPKAVEELNITSFDSASACLTWKAVERATGYYVYVGEAESPDVVPTYKKLTLVTDSSYKITNLKPCRYYSFRILPCYKNSAGKNLYGAYAQSEVIFTPVAKISGFSITETTNTYVSVKWTAQPTVSGYYLSMRTDGEDTATIVATLPSTSSSYIFEGLEELTNYRFYIRAFYNMEDETVLEGKSSGALTKTDDSHVDSVTFTKTKASIYTGYNSLFEVEVKPYYATNQKVTFSSDNKDVATVYSNGRVVGIKPGTATITVKSQDGGLTDSVTVRIIPVKSKSISVPTAITAYMNEYTTISPTFSPAKTTDKSFTVIGKDYTYSYKGGFLGTQTKTETCKFSDYVTVNESGQIIPKKLTIEPETGKEFSFSITVRANDTGVSDTSKLRVVTKPLKISYQGTENNPWVYGNSVQLNAAVNSSAGFTKDDLIWQSDNTKIATVSSNGTVTCTGTGSVTITAFSPDKQHSDSFSIFVNPKISIPNSFYHGCSVGDEYVIAVQVAPSDSSVSFFNMNPDIISVSENGKVSIQGEGTASVIVSSGATSKTVVFTNEIWVKPSEDEQNLLDFSINRLNSVKAEMPMFIRSDYSLFSSFSMSSTNAYMTSDDLEDLFGEFAAPTTKVVHAVKQEDYPNLSDYSNQRSKYLLSVPVSGMESTVLNGLTLIDIKSIVLTDNNEPTYDITFTLNSESMPTASSATVNTRHGKVFDILTGSYINNCVSLLNSGSSSSFGSLKVTYSNFSQLYNNSSVTVTIDKITGKVENISYDMNISISISELNISMGIITALDSGLAFNVNNRVNIDVINK